MFQRNLSSRILEAFFFSYKIVIFCHFSKILEWKQRSDMTPYGFRAVLSCNTHTLSKRNGVTLAVFSIFLTKQRKQLLTVVSGAMCFRTYFLHDGQGKLPHKHGKVLFCGFYEYINFRQ